MALRPAVTGSSPFAENQQPSVLPRTECRRDGGHAWGREACKRHRLQTRVGGHMGLTSEQAHWIVGGELNALALVSMLYENADVAIWCVTLRPGCYAAPVRGAGRAHSRAARRRGPRVDGRSDGPTFRAGGSPARLGVQELVQAHGGLEVPLPSGIPRRLEPSGTVATGRRGRGGRRRRCAGAAAVIAEAARDRDYRCGLAARLRARILGLMRGRHTREER